MNEHLVNFFFRRLLSTLLFISWKRCFHCWLYWFFALQSKFEFQLRLQEFIELVRADTADSYKQAILYARKHLVPWGATHMKELQHVLATLAVKSTTECTKYKVKFSFFWWYGSAVINWCINFCFLYGITELLIFFSKIEPKTWLEISMSLLTLACLSNPLIYFWSLLMAG